MTLNYDSMSAHMVALLIGYFDLTFWKEKQHPPIVFNIHRLSQSRAILTSGYLLPGVLA